jgi:hypothetical protein
VSRAGIPHLPAAGCLSPTEDMLTGWFFALSQCRMPVPAAVPQAFAPVSLLDSAQALPASASTQQWHKWACSDDCQHTFGIAVQVVCRRQLITTAMPSELGQLWLRSAGTLQCGEAKSCSCARAAAADSYCHSIPACSPTTSQSGEPSNTCKKTGPLLLQGTDLAAAGV